MSPPPGGRPSRPRSPRCPHPCHLLWLQKAGAVCPSTAAHAGLMGWLVRPESHAEALTPGPLNVTIWSQRLEGGKLEGFQGGGLTPPPGPPRDTTFLSCKDHQGPGLCPLPSPPLPSLPWQQQPQRRGLVSAAQPDSLLPKKAARLPRTPLPPPPLPPSRLLGPKVASPTRRPSLCGRPRGPVRSCARVSPRLLGFQAKPKEGCGSSRVLAGNKGSLSCSVLKAFRDGPVTWVWALRKALLGPPRLQGRDRGQVIGEGGYGRSCHRG